ncbi:GTP-binding protein [Corynebacterium felinum]|uniref:sulfate adenylyltransferase n=1 Tax=Corynebacterium felinum TaxID=131318 RepID=A0ABU2B5R7_9CORY|nr:GTP-binding protein [Corynebacterium felinum]MDF5821746.1 GTP-binding protein [Corynebacterium felinum]MDR7353962.1 sulfate adenylyltransferase subunit 1 [Corynebacterium felinum]WJY96135.1 Sulfate adenylyltransferase subunit 1 [Corynebacterium felinum]
MSALDVAPRTHTHSEDDTSACSTVVRKTLRLCTAGSVDDGKSTFVGRLLHDTNSVRVDQLEHVTRSSHQRGFAGIDFSLLVDGLRAEREQGITIDVAYRYFSTKARTFILADTPGHVQYTRNTVTGMSTSDVVVLLVDARTGVSEQTRKHLSVAGLLGVSAVILAVNKIDLVDYSEDIFNQINADFTHIATSYGINRTFAVPISALHGDNVAEASTAMDWYTGSTVLDLLETIDVDTDTTPVNARFPIQYVIREHSNDYRGYAGTLATGELQLGQKLYTSCGREATVIGIDTTDGETTTARAGQSICVRLAEDIDLSRGDLLSAKPVAAQRTFTATIVGVHETPLNPGQLLKLRTGTSSVRARIATQNAPQSVGLNDIAEITIELATPLPVETYHSRGAVGSFLLIDANSGDTRAAGIITAVP